MKCENFGVCGGCVYLDMPYADELFMKEANVRSLLLEAGFDGVFEGIVPAPSPYAYRNKMEFAFGDECKGGRLALGIRKRRNYYEVAIPTHCVLIPDIFRDVLLTTLEYFREAGETFYHRRTHEGALRHLVLRRGAFTGDVLINLSAASGLRTPLEPLIESVRRLTSHSNHEHVSMDGGKTTFNNGEPPSCIIGFLHATNDGVSDTVKNENIRTLWGRDFFYEKICGLTFKVTAFSFFQTNSAGAACLYDIVADYAGTGEMAYDLYCGAGTITQIVAKNFQSVVGVELSEDAVRAATENAAMNNIDGCTFVAGDVLRVADELAEHGTQPDVIIVDPPRDGLHPKALPKIAMMNAKRIVYVSCKPQSLARDMTALAAYGYRAVRAICVDMFPRTANVESCCLFERV